MTSDGHEWTKLSIERKIGTQIKSWSEHSISERMPFITISREFGSEGWIVGQKLEEYLNKDHKYDPPWVAYNKEVLELLDKDAHLTRELVESLEKPAQNAISEFFDSYFGNKPSRISIFKKTAKVIKTIASHGHVIIVGRGGCFITQDMKKGFHIRCVAPVEWRVNNISNQFNITHYEAEQMVQKMTNERDAFIKDYFFTDVNNSDYYDLVINTAKFPLEDVVDVIVYAMKKRNLL